MLENRLALRRMKEYVLCEVITQLQPHEHQEEKLAEEINQAKDLLKNSTIQNLVKEYKLKWLVIEDYGSGSVQIWPKK